MLVTLVIIMVEETEVEPLSETAQACKGREEEPIMMYCQCPLLEFEEFIGLWKQRIR